jgi:hypothetical protein
MWNILGGAWEVAGLYRYAGTQVMLQLGTQQLDGCHELNVTEALSLNMKEREGLQLRVSSSKGRVWLNIRSQMCDHMRDIP